MSYVVKFQMAVDYARSSQDPNGGRGPTSGGLKPHDRLGH